MGSKKESSSGIVSSLWRNWVGLDPTRRNEVATRLGPLGHVLSIAANVHEFANKVESQPVVDENDSTTPDDDDIIDVEFEEIDEDG